MNILIDILVLALIKVIALVLAVPMAFGILGIYVSIDDRDFRYMKYYLSFLVPIVGTIIFYKLIYNEIIP